MKNKKILVIGIALILLALVAGVSFAAKGNEDGVIWVVIEGRSSRLSRQETAYYMEIYNSNNYAVTVYAKKGNDIREVRLSAGQTVHVDAYRDSKLLSTVKK
jgi:uncharacterized protein YxeA